jgi:hypothetical protein
MSISRLSCRDAQRLCCSEAQFTSGRLQLALGIGQWLDGAPYPKVGPLRGVLVC